MDRRDGPTNTQLAGMGATMGAPLDITLLFHGGAVLPLGTAGGRMAGVNGFWPDNFVGDEIVCIQNAHSLASVDVV